MKDQDKQQDQTITPAGEIELTEEELREEELDQVAGGFLKLDGSGISKGRIQETTGK